MNFLFNYIILLLSMKCLVKSVNSDSNNNLATASYIDINVQKPFLLSIVNDYETLEVFDVNGKIKFNDDDINYLSSPCNGNTECIGNKSLSEIKYKQKMEALQCVNGVIVYYLLNEMKSVLFNNKQWKFRGRSVYYFVKKIISRMIALLFLGRINTHGLFWRIFICVTAADAWPYFFLRTNIIDFDQYECELTGYIKMCRQYNYLPNTNPEIEVSHSDTFYENMVKSDMVAFVNKYYNAFGGNVIISSRNFIPDNFVFVDYLHRFNDLVFLSETYEFNWGDYEKYLKAKKNEISNTYRTVDWVKDPFKFIHYQSAIVKIVELNFFYVIWLQLKLLREIILMRQNDIDPLIDTMFKILCCQMVTILAFLHSEDRTLWNIHYRLVNFISQDPFDYGSIADELQSMKDKLETTIADDLELLNENNDGISLEFDKEIDIDQLEKASPVDTIIDELIAIGAANDEGRCAWYDLLTNTKTSDINEYPKKILEIFITFGIYIYNFGYKIRPLDYFFIKYFRNGAFDLKKTFFLPR